MTKKHRIPNRLFVEAGRSVEEALRRDTSNAVAEFMRDGDLIVTWEDGKVVLLHGSAASQTRGSAPGFASARPSLPAAEAIREYKSLFLDLVLRVSQKIYLSGEALYIEFPRAEKEVGDFLSSPDNQDVLRDICRELAGRQMAVRLIFVDEFQPVKSPYVNHEAFVVNHLRVMAFRLEEAGNSLQATRIEEVLARRNARLLPATPGLQPARPSGASPERPQTARIFHQEGDPNPSHKSGE